MDYKTNTKIFGIEEVVDFKAGWADMENEKMVQFIDLNRQHLIGHIEENNELQNKTNRNQFFIMMSKFIGSKTRAQCKSRYQKKETQLLKRLKFPSDLLNKYFERKNKNKKPRKAKHTSTESSRTSDSIIKPDECSLSSIKTFSDLKQFILSDCVPKIKNNVVKVQLEYFLENLPIENNLNEELSVCNFPSEIEYQNFNNFEYNFQGDFDMIDFEDYIN